MSCYPIAYLAWLNASVTKFATIQLAGCSEIRYLCDMEPASTIIAALGGPTAIAEAVGVHRTRVSMWQAARERGGTNGLIPYRHVPRLLKLAEEQGVELEPGDFIPPRDTAA